jgi:hypothetical protein
MPPRKRKQPGNVRTLAAADQVVSMLDERYAIARQALDLRNKGYSLWEIAELLEISEAEARRGLVAATKAAAELLNEGQKAELLAIEVMRLDRLQTPYFDAAMQGDVRAADFVLRVIAQRAKLLGLDQSVTIDARKQTVIVAGGEQDYIAALRAVRDKIHSESEAS